MALPEYPTGPMVRYQIQHEADVMLKVGVLRQQYNAKADQGTLAGSMLGS